MGNRPPEKGGALHENIPRAQGSVMTRRRKTAEVKAGTVSDSLGVDPEVISRLKAPGGLELKPTSSHGPA